MEDDILLKRYSLLMTDAMRWKYDGNIEKAKDKISKGLVSETEIINEFIENNSVTLDKDLIKFLDNLFEEELSND